MALLMPFLGPILLHFQDINNLDYASQETIHFQRWSVIITEFVLLYVVFTITRSWSSNRRLLALFLVATHPGLMIVDHIHFQYNGILLGMFLASIWAVSSDYQIAGSILFASLLCSKHIFLYAAPGFFVFLLRHYCTGRHRVARFFILGGAVSITFAALLGPFIYAGQLMQLLKRLFPVSRGLLHAYWAPNAWALYAALDKFLAATLPKIGLASAVRPTGAASLTGGLVQDAWFSVLPNINSAAAATCSLLAMFPALLTTWVHPEPVRFPRLITYVTLSAFLFGFHVHEKAILMPLAPLLMLAASGKDADAVREYSFLLTVGTYSLFPLLTRMEEYAIKILLLVTHISIALPWLSNPEFWAQVINDANPRPLPSSLARPLLSSEVIYLWGLLPLELYCLFGHRAIFGHRLPFLPLALTSVYCAIGILYVWLGMMMQYCSALVLYASTKDKTHRVKQS